MNKRLFMILSSISLAIIFILVLIFNIAFNRVCYDMGIRNNKYKYYGNEIKEEFASYDKYGYDFIGWSEIKNDEAYIINYPYKIKKNITLYAIYKLKDDMNLPIINVETNNKGNVKSKYHYNKAIINTKNDINALEDTECKIRVRGNSTHSYPKRPYKIDFKEKTSLLGLSSAYHFVLLADYLDTSLIKNYAGLSLASRMSNLNYSVNFKHVELYLNGVYQGVYLLTDQIEASNGSNVDIEVNELKDDFPFLIEKDSSVVSIGDELNVDYFYYINSDGIKNKYNIKYPANPTMKQINYIRNYVKNVDEAIKNNNLNKINELLDVNSLIDYYLVQEMMSNSDASNKSIFMYKKENGKMEFGPLWDFDVSNTGWTNKPTISDPDYWTNKHIFIDGLGDNWFSYYIKSNEGKELLKLRFNELYLVTNDLVEELKEYKKYISRAALANLKLWYYDYLPGGKENYITSKSLFEDQYDSFVLYLKNHNESLKNYINSL